MKQVVGIKHGTRSWVRRLLLPLVAVSASALVGCGAGVIDSDGVSRLQANMRVEGELVPVVLEEVDGEFVLEGDIVVDRRLVPDLPAREGEGEIEQGLATATLNFVWPNGLIPFTFDSSLSSTAKNDAIRAMDHWKQNTLIRFLPRTNEAAYVTFRKGSGCSATIGRTGRQQFVNLAANCGFGTVIHEIGHAVGAFHEQSRRDRDQYVIINFENVIPGQEDQFAKYRAGAGKDRGPYDFNSIMHYTPTEFSRNGKPTISRRDGQSLRGRGSALTATDVGAIRQLYREYFLSTEL